LPAYLSIVIPAYNEEKRLPATLDRIETYLETWGRGDYELLVVDDGSRDATAAMVEQRMRSNPRLQLLKNPGNRGKGYAVRNGLSAAQGEWVLFSDADLSTPIEELPKLLDAAVSRNAAIAFGSRALDRKLVKVHQPWMRELSGRVFNVFMRLMTGLPFADTQCGFKLFRREAAHAIAARQIDEGFSFDVEQLMIARRLGYRAVEVPVEWSNVEGTTVSLAKGMESFWNVVKIRWRDLNGGYR
jgi:glycosyltransferase involved in cell wall biosynthesis